MYGGYYGYGVSRAASRGDEVAGVFFAIILAIFVFALIFAVVNYLLKGFGMYGMAKKLGIPNPWLAFIPIASNYLQGELAGEFKIGTKYVKNGGLWTLLTPIVAGVVIGLFYIPLVISLMIGSIMDGGTSAFSGFSFLFFILFMLIVLAASTAENLVFALFRYQTHKRYVDDAWSVIHMILGLFIPLYQSIYYYVLRNRYPLGMEPAAPQPMQYTTPDAGTDGSAQ